MYVIEVRPKRAWRGLRLKPHGGLVFGMTKHRTASHWFEKSTAALMLASGKYAVRATVKPLTECPPDRIGIRECTCAPISFRPRRRKRGR